MSRQKCRLSSEESSRKDLIGRLKGEDEEKPNECG